MSDDLYSTLDMDAKTSHADSPFVAIGGSAAVAGVVDEFYRRLLADPATAGFFTTVLEQDGLGALKRHQVLLLAKVLGGPDRYDGRDLGVAHAGMNITPVAYQRVSLHLLLTLHDAGVPIDIVAAAASVLESVSGAIITA
jgi:hemoglobin